MRYLVIVVALAVPLAACKKSHLAPADMQSTDAAVAQDLGEHDAAELVDLGDDLAAADMASDCFTNPTTYFEIINACTTAKRFAKSPLLPLETADGGRPPLP